MDKSRQRSYNDELIVDISILLLFSTDVYSHQLFTADGKFYAGADGSYTQSGNGITASTDLDNSEFLCSFYLFVLKLDMIKICEIFQKFCRTIDNSTMPPHFG